MQNKKHTDQQEEQRSAKRPFVTPSLERYGKVSEVTGFSFPGGTP